MGEMYVHLSDNKLKKSLPQIELDIDSYDLISLVFLLYDVPEDAFDRILCLEREREHQGVLVDWAAADDNNLSLKFLEALYVCQLNFVIKNLGLSVSKVKEYFSTERFSYIDPMKKSLYKLCEQITSDNLKSLKSALISYEMNISDYKTCELIFLHLNMRNFITVTPKCGVNTAVYKITRLLDIIVKLPAIDPNVLSEVKMRQTDFDEVNETYVRDEIRKPAFTSFWNPLRLSSINMNTITTDATKARRDIYHIKDPSNVGVCYIINQEHFYPSAKSIATSVLKTNLTTRRGSSIDRDRIKKTMESKNFRTIFANDLDHVYVKESICHVVDKVVNSNDSMFMLFVLSHGYDGHVYAADCVPVSIHEIKSWIETKLRDKNVDIPILIFIQACQVIISTERLINDNGSTESDSESGSESNVESCHALSDGLCNDQCKRSNATRKSHFLIGKATCSELKAFRFVVDDVDQGSVFVYYLCENFDKYGHCEDLLAILTRVNKDVTDYTANQAICQVSVSEFSLTKTLYLEIPKIIQ